MRRHSRRAVPASAPFIAVIATFALVRCSCGSDSTSHVAHTTGNRRSPITPYAELAAHTDNVTAGRRAAQNWAQLVASLRRAWRHRSSANRTTRRTVKRPAVTHEVETVRSTAFDICAPNRSHGGSRHARLDWARLRHVTLYSLNLSCPAS